MSSKRNSIYFILSFLSALGLFLFAIILSFLSVLKGPVWCAPPARPPGAARGEVHRHLHQQRVAQRSVRQDLQDCQSLHRRGEKNTINTKLKEYRCCTSPLYIIYSSVLTLTDVPPPGAIWKSCHLRVHFHVEGTVS